MGTESQIVFDNNHGCEHPFPFHPDHDLPYGPDPINIFDLKGKQVGYSWNYGDSVELVVNIQKTVLRVNEDQLDELEVFLSDKELEFNFTNMRGEDVYTFYLPAKMITKIRLNTDEDNLIARNTYTFTVVLINPYDNSRINLLLEPYKVYVK